MEQYIEKIMEQIKDYKKEDEELGEEFLYKGNKEEFDNWMKRKRELDIKIETCYEIIEKIGG